MKFKNLAAISISILIILFTACVSKSEKNGTDQQQGKKTTAEKSITTVSESEGEGIPDYSFSLPDKRIALIPPELEKRVKNDPVNNLQGLVDYLLEGVENPFHRTKIIHDWVTHNIAYDASAFFGESPMIVNVYDVIRHGSSVCAGYSNVFQQICSLANIECLIINGYGRGVGFDPLESMEKSYDSNHAWNAVKIQNKWYLVDSTWDAGHLKDNKFEWAYSTNYLFTDPSGFIYTHYPEDPEWQLLEQSLSYKEFSSLPNLPGSFFRYGLSLETDLKVFNRVRDSFKVKLKGDPTLDLVADLRLKDSTRVTGRILMDIKKGEWTIKGTFPNAGTYYLYLFAKKEGKEKGSFLGEIVFQAADGTDLVYPYLYKAFYTMGLLIEDDLPTAGDPGTEAKITINAPEDIMLIANLRDIQGNVIKNRTLTQRENGKYVVYTSFPDSGKYLLNIFARRKKENAKYQAVANYTYSVKGESEFGFPLVYSSFLEKEATLFSPLYNPLPLGEDVFFDVSSSSVSAMGVIVKGEYISLKKTGENRFQGNIHIGGNEINLCYKSGNTWYPLVLFGTSR